MNFLHRKSGKIIVLLIFIILLGILAMIFFQPKETAVNSEKKNILAEAFEKSGATFQELTVQSWAKIEAASENGQDLYSIFQRIEKTLGNEAQYEVTESKDEFHEGLQVTGKTKEGYAFSMTLQSIADEKGGDDTYLVVNAAESLDYAEVGTMVKTVESYFKALGATGDSSVLLSGVYPRIFSQAEKEAKAKAIFAAANAKVLESVDNDGYLSQSGYTSGIEKTVVSAQEKINLQIALFDNEVQGQSCVFIGSPLIFSEY